MNEKIWESESPNFATNINCMVEFPSSDAHNLLMPTPTLGQGECTGD